jgi:cholest-4-en-3-one 26-monooxygenase
VACELPLQAIADLMGFPQEDRRKIFDWSNEMIGYDDPEYDVDPEAAAELLGYSMEMAEERKGCPMPTTSSPSWCTPTSTATSSPPRSSASS